MKKIRRKKTFIGILCLVIFGGNICEPGMCFQTQNVE